MHSQWALELLWPDAQKEVEVQLPAWSASLTAKVEEAKESFATSQLQEERSPQGREDRTCCILREEARVAKELCLAWDAV